MQILKFLSQSSVDLLRSGLHAETLDLIFSLPNSRANSVSLLIEFEDHIIGGNGPSSVQTTQFVQLLGLVVQKYCDRARASISSCLYEDPDDTNKDDTEPAADNNDDDFNYMNREEQRCENAEVADETVTENITLGAFARFIPMLQQIIASSCSADDGDTVYTAEASALRVAALIAIGQYMVQSRKLAGTHCNEVVRVLHNGCDSTTRHAALAVVSDLLHIIPTHASLIEADGYCVLATFLHDTSLGRAALQTLMRLCSIRVLQIDIHLGVIAGCLGCFDNQDDDKIFSFFSTHIHAAKRSPAQKARIIYAAMCQCSAAAHELPSADGATQAMVALATEFSKGSSDELAALLVKRLIDRIDPVAVAVLESLKGVAAIVPALAISVTQRNVAALAFGHCRSEATVESALAVVRSLRRILQSSVGQHQILQSRTNKSMGSVESLHQAIADLGRSEQRLISGFRSVHSNKEYVQEREQEKAMEEEEKNTHDTVESVSLKGSISAESSSSGSPPSSAMFVDMSSVSVWDEKPHLGPLDKVKGQEAQVPHDDGEKDQEDITTGAICVYEEDEQEQEHQEAAQAEAEAVMEQAVEVRLPSATRKRGREPPASVNAMNSTEKKMPRVVPAEQEQTAAYSTPHNSADTDTDSRQARLEPQKSKPTRRLRPQGTPISSALSSDDDHLFLEDEPASDDCSIAVSTSSERSGWAGLLVESEGDDDSIGLPNRCVGQTHAAL